MCGGFEPTTLKLEAKIDTNGQKSRYYLFVLFALRVRLFNSALYYVLVSCTK